MINIDAEDHGIQDALKQVIAKTGNPKGILEAIGEYEVASTKARFGSSIGPDGKPWASNSQVTILRYLAGRSGSFKKDGTLSAKGAGLAAGKKPLIGRGGAAGLHALISYRIQGADTLLVGSPKVYASAQQFGMKRGFAGTNRRGSPIPWGDIPARPFLGISKEDRVNILAILAEQMLPNSA